MGEPAIECEGLTRSFSAGMALDALTLDVAPGEVLALLGPNGAGKTTTMRLLNGVLEPDRGTATVLGLDPWRDGNRLRHRTGVVTENAGLDERFSALENLEFVARMRGMDEGTATRRAGELLERFGMSHRSDVKVQGFSTGQRKRIALARALLHDPELIFLDEPTSGLDPAATRDVVGLIGSLASEQGRTIVLCTHFLGEAGRLADRVAVLFGGRLHAFGRPEELAAELWSSNEVHLDLGSEATDEVLAALARLEMVAAAAPSTRGAVVRITDREAVPAVVGVCVTAGASVYGVDLRTPTLEDIYFEVEARSGDGRGTGAAPVATPGTGSAPTPGAAR